jgi:tetratricopeptide (TPR) repeat protein
MSLITIWHWLSDPDNRGKVTLIAGLVFGIVGGLWTFYIYLSGPKPQPDINQHISGESTGFVHTGTGSVFITNTKGVSTKEFQRLAEELGITKAALNTFLKILEEKHVPPEDLDHTLRRIAQRYNELKKELEAFRSDDPAIVELKKRARDALDVGNFEEAERLLNEASDKDVDAARRLKKVAEERFLSAAASKAENGDLKWTQLDYFAAAGYYRKAAELVPEGHDEQLAKYLNMAGRAYNEAGRYSEAEPLYKRSLQIREKVLGPEHPDVAASLNNLALLYRDQGRYPEAEPLYKRSLEIVEKVLGPEHPDVATSLNNLAELYRNQGRYSEAKPLHKRSLQIREKVLGPEHPDVAGSLNNLAALYHNQGRYPEAEPLYKRSLEIMEKILGPEHPGVATSLNNLAELYRNQGRYSEAEPLYKRSLEIWEKILGPEHPNVATVLENYADLLQKMDREKEAAELAARAESIRNKK